MYMPSSSDDPIPIHDLEQLGATLRDARRSLGLTQVDAAQLSGVSTRLWNETELGKRRQLGLDTILRMLNTMGIDLQLVARGRGREDRAAAESAP